MVVRFESQSAAPEGGLFPGVGRRAGLLDLECGRNIVGGGT